MKKLIKIFALLLILTPLFSYCYEEKQTNYTNSWTTVGPDRIIKQYFFIKTDYIDSISVLVNKTEDNESHYGNLTLTLYDDEGNIVKEVNIDTRNLSKGLHWLNFSLKTNVKPFNYYYYTLTTKQIWTGSLIAMFGVDYYDADGPYKIGDAYYFNGEKWINKSNGFFGVDYTFKVLSNCYNKDNPDNVLFYYGWINTTGGYYHVCKKCFSYYTMSVVADKNKNSLLEIKNYTKTFLYYPLGSSFANSEDDEEWLNNVKKFIDEYSNYVSGGFFFDEIDKSYFPNKNISFFNKSLKELVDYVHSKGLKVIINGHRYYANYGDYYLWESFITSNQDYKILNFFSPHTEGWESNYDKYLYLKNHNLLDKTIALAYADLNKISLQDAIILYLFAKGLGIKYFAVADKYVYSSSMPKFYFFTFYNYYYNKPNVLVINNSGAWINYNNETIFLDLNKSYEENKLIYYTTQGNFQVYGDRLKIKKDDVEILFEDPKLETNSQDLIKINLVKEDNTKKIYQIEPNFNFTSATVIFYKPKNIFITKLLKCENYDESYNCLSDWYSVPFTQTKDKVIVKVNSFSLFQLDFIYLREMKMDFTIFNVLLDKIIKLIKKFSD